MTDNIKNMIKLVVENKIKINEGMKLIKTHDADKSELNRMKEKK